MPHVDSAHGAALGGQLDCLIHEFRGWKSAVPDDLLRQICSRLATISPFTSAGFFRFEDASNTFEWLHLSDPANESMTSSLQLYSSELTDMFENGALFQHDSTSSAPRIDGFFVGLPAGALDDMQIGLGLSASRRLKNDEISRMEAFGLMMGLLAENSRLSRMVSEADEAGSTARLIGFIAHELRTPLTGMRGNIQLALMASRKGQQDRIPNRLEAAINGVDEMTELVQKLLDVSRLERGKFPMHPSEGKLGDTITQGVELFRSRPNMGEQSVHIDQMPEIVVSHDHEALQRAVVYFLTHAMRYSSEASTTTVSLEEDTQHAKVNIMYSGSSFSGDDLAALSAPLSSSKPSSERSDHLSLELAYCRGIVQQHGGQIALHTDKPAPGQQMIEIILPISRS